MEYSKLDADKQTKAWARVEELLRRDYVNPDIQAVKIICSCFAAHRITQHPPVWVMCVAPSGSLKTAVLQCLDGLATVHFIDEVTPNTFVSGRIPDQEPGQRKPRNGEKRTPASLLHRIGTDGYLIAADFSTILSMDERSRARILAQLRRIYDGHFSREFGTEENLNEREWKGRLTFITGATPDIDAHYMFFRSLGERFVQVRWPRAGGVEAGLSAMRKRPEAAAELKQAIQEMLRPILTSEFEVPIFPREFEKRVAHLGEFVALARTHVPRSRSDHELEGPVFPEGNTRLPQEFAQIGRGAALLAARTEVTEEDFALVRRTAFDCIPAARASVIKALQEGRTTSSAGLPPAVLQRTLEDLAAVGIVAQKVMKGQNAPYTLTKYAQELLTGIDAISPKMDMDVREV